MEKAPLEYLRGHLSSQQANCNPHNKTKDILQNTSNSSFHGSQNRHCRENFTRGMGVFMVRQGRLLLSYRHTKLT